MRKICLYIIINALATMQGYGMFKIKDGCYRTAVVVKRQNNDGSFEQEVRAVCVKKIMVESAKTQAPSAKICQQKEPAPQESEHFFEIAEDFGLRSLLLFSHATVLQAITKIFYR